jgi:hypothetical protein
MVDIPQQYNLAPPRIKSNWLRRRDCLHWCVSNADRYALLRLVALLQQVVCRNVSHAT